MRKKGWQRRKKRTIKVPQDRSAGGQGEEGSGKSKPARGRCMVTGRKAEGRKYYMALAGRRTLEGKAERKEGDRGGQNFPNVPIKKKEKKTRPMT